MNTNFSNLGLNNINHWIEPATEIGLAAACIPFNQESSSLLEYYYTSGFVDTGKKLLDEAGVIKKETKLVPIHDQLLYHTILYVLGSSISHKDYILPFLSTPYVMRAVCEDGWFQLMKANIGSVVLNKLKNFAILYGKKQTKNYIERKIIDPIKKLIIEDKSVLLENLRQSCVAALTAKKEAAENLWEESEDTIAAVPEIIRSGVKIQHLENGIDRIGRVTTEIKTLVETPKITLYDKKVKTSIFFKVNAISALSASNLSQLATFALTSSSPDVTELFIRLGGAIAATVTGYPMTTTMATEIVNASFPKSWRSKVTLPATVGKNLQQIRRRFKRCFNEAKESGLAEMNTAGLKKRTIKLVSKAVPQTLVAHTFVVLFANNHPLANAFSATSFIEYMGTLGEYHGLIKEKSLKSESAYLDRFPLQAGVGMALTGLESFIEFPRPFSSIIATTFAVPLIADRIVNTDFYQTRILLPIKQTMIPNYNSMRKVALVRKMESLFGKPFSNNKWFQRAVILTSSVGAGVLLQSPITRKAIKTAKDTAIMTMQVYNRYSIYSTVWSMTGSAMSFAIPSLINRNVKSIVSSTVGVAVGIVTEDPLTAAIAVEVAETVLDANKIKSTFSSVTQKCTGFFRSIYRTISDVIENEARMIQESVA